MLGWYFSPRNIRIRDAFVLARERAKGVLRGQIIEHWREMAKKENTLLILYITM